MTVVVNRDLCLTITLADSFVLSFIYEE